ncbi:low-specificity L-threonine aldolase [bacterium]|nr:low-specificity L-threonine aldolase [bacterium]
MKIVDLRSDTVTKPTPDMREAMFDAAVGDDVFGEDPTVNALQQKVAALFGHEDALFVASGTMGNQVAVKTHTQPGNEIICEADCHIFKYEAGGAGMLSGLLTHLIKGEHGVMTAAQIEEAINPDDIHSAPTALIALENTHNRAGGTIYPFDEIKRIADLTKRKNIAFHLDGARIFNACIAANIAPADYGKCFNSISVCFSKGLGAPVGSALIGSKPFIKKARYFRKMLGGGMRQAGFLAAAAIYALDNNVGRLKEDHDKAQLLAKTVSNIPAFSIDLTSVQTNIVIFSVSQGSSHDVIEKLHAHGILAIPFSNKKIRFVTHLDVPMKDIEWTCEVLKKNF